MDDIDADMMEDALINFRDKMEGRSMNRSLGTFEKIKRGNAAIAYRWASKMMDSGFNYKETFNVVNHRTGIELAEWDELIREGENELNF